MLLYLDYLTPNTYRQVGEGGCNFSRVAKGGVETPLPVINDHSLTLDGLPSQAPEESEPQAM